ncbi:hypothetical protein [Streptomyces tauricus]|uniref:hypothetical protein n=1 Tax=Streptomyces tauricus TaxID=68274 RepID=UPI00341F9D10
MPSWLVDALADMNVPGAIFLAVWLFGSGACLLLIAIEVRHFVPARLRRRLPVQVRITGLRIARATGRARVVVIAWFLAPVGTPISSSAPKKGAHHA